MAYNFPFDDWIDALRALCAATWGVTSDIPEVTPTYHWRLEYSDLPLALIENPGTIEFRNENAIHDLDEWMPVRLWYMAQFEPGDDVPLLLRAKGRDMAQALYADRSLGGLLNKLDLVGMDISGVGAEWPVERLEEMNDVAACFVEARLLLVESRF